ncbi:protein YLS9-like [Pyrus ussuriensis x Pyrus communis]|uniref:Protein YLS9-like n=1 Tax=Pyrus ussuriensis x Pyrus communis TaxID=2448454 RepID=A0A5N5HNB8_9ROSA|nr:protein YLS9-like [Pyrus ussuriensis x Pyrus communis]
MMVVVAVFTIMSIIFFISWLAFLPQLPKFQIESANVSLLNATGSELTAIWDFTLLIANPNHKLNAAGRFLSEMEAQWGRNGEGSGCR